MTVQPYAQRTKRVVQASVSFPGSAVSDQFANPREIRLTQKPSSHELLTLTYEFLLADTRALRTGSPVVLTWSTSLSGETSTWIGYVYAVRPRKVSESSAQTEVICVSPSLVLKQAGQNVWPGMRLTDTAKDILRLAGLDANVKDHPLTETVLQAGRTYWEVLRDITQRLGFTLTVDGTQVNILPASEIFATYASRARVLATGSSGMELKSQDSDSTLYSITPELSDLSDDTYGLAAGVTSWSLNPISGTYSSSRSQQPADMIGVTRDDPLIERFSTRVAYDSSTSRAHANAEVSNRRWIRTATVYGTGSPYLKPFRPIYVEGAADSANGWWQILEVEHEIINRKEYTARMRVGMDGDNPPYPRPQPTPEIAPSTLVKKAPPRRPIFVERLPAPTGLSGAGDVGGFWVSQRMR